MKILGIIPARFASTRLPAKLLKQINGKSILEMVYRQCLKATCLTDVVIATDSTVIYEHVLNFGGKVVMTNEAHPSGTDRCAEALAKMGGKEKYDFVVNIQGDEPLMDPENISRLCNSFSADTEISSVFFHIKDSESLFNPNVVKVVVGEQNQALYFSRSPIPYLREVEQEKWVDSQSYYKHLGMYGFRSDTLEKIVNLPVAHLEATEKLEQLRWLSNGFKINMVEVFTEGIGIDTEEDFQRLKQFLESK